MSATPSATQRLLKVSVVIPPSPFRSVRHKLKENASGPPKRKADDQPTQAPTKKARKISDGEEYVYCHQCCMKRDLADCAQCTSHRKKDVPCRTNFCRNCLHNRYNQDLENIKPVGVEGYTFKCFRCQDTCNCSKCRKLRGLPPTGNLHLEEVKVNVKRTSPAMVEAKHVVESGVKAKVAAPIQIPKPRQPRPKPKIIPSLHWNSLDTYMRLDEAEDRIFIREFVARFAPDTQFDKSHVEELSFIAGNHATADGELATWISEPCLKVILMWLLEVLVDDTDDHIHQQLLKNTLTDIRKAGGNLNKTWLALDGLRRNATVSVDISDPLPCPDSVVMRSTRSTRGGDPNAISIAQTAQLVPVILGLVVAALHTEAIRSELNEGLQRQREFIREKQDGAKKENEKWDMIQGGDVVAQASDIASHKRALEDLGHALKVALSECALRSGPLGVDGDGRKYWALSPGAYDRQYAKDVLTWHSEGGQKTKPKRGRYRYGKKGDSGSMLEWSSVVVVWGRKPSDAIVIREADNEDVDQDRWWVFSDAKEVGDLALWLDSMVDEEKPQVAAQLKALVSELRGHASILKWKESLAKDAA